jgi:hypothetical protein
MRVTGSVAAWGSGTGNKRERRAFERKVTKGTKVRNFERGFGLVRVTGSVAAWGREQGTKGSEEHLNRR